MDLILRDNFFHKYRENLRTHKNQIKVVENFKKTLYRSYVHGTTSQ
jgi:hypothetical protein